MSMKRQESKENPEIIYHSSSPTWIYKDRDKMEEDVFLFDSEDMFIISEESYA